VSAIERTMTFGSTRVETLSATGPIRCFRIAAISAIARLSPVVARKRSPYIARAFADALVGLTGKDARPLDGFLILFRSTSSPVAAQIARDRIATAHQAAAESVVDGPARRAVGFGILQLACPIHGHGDRDDEAGEAAMNAPVMNILGA